MMATEFETIVECFSVNMGTAKATYDDIELLDGVEDYRDYASLMSQAATLRLSQVDLITALVTDFMAMATESEATGETAAIFADIRETMQLPFITSIWRTLVAIDGGLNTAWEAAKPLYETGQPAAVVLNLRRRAMLPVPEPEQHLHKCFPCGFHL